MRLRRAGRRSAMVIAGALLLGGVAGPAPASLAETVEPNMQIEGWYSRPKPRSPQVDTPAGPVSPGPDFPPDPRGSDGNFVTASSGGQPGETDTAWAAFQWDTFAAVGGTVEKFEVTFTRSPQARGDFGTGYPDIMRACNIVVAWGAAPTANAWQDRPTADCSQAVAPEVDGGQFHFDFTHFASTWLEGEGFGVVIMPGNANDPSENIAPFQVTFAGQSNPVEEARPKVVFEFTAGSTDLGPPIIPPSGGFGGFEGGGGGGFVPADPPTGSGGFSDPGPAPDADPSGESPVTDDVEPLPDETAAPDPISSSGGFPLLALVLMLVLAGAAFWGLGTALGPAGDPVPVRQGGVSRLLAHQTDRAGTTGSL